MIKQQNNLNNDRYLITTSLLNSWAYIWNCVDGVKEAETDKISFDEKLYNKQKNAYEGFVSALNRIKTPTNEFMQLGIDFEKDCYDGKTEFSKIIENGQFQVVGMKEIEVDGMKFLMYGILDVLKAGVIYDIKRVIKYSRPKYINSFQHNFYFCLYPNVKEFTYLIYDGYKYHKESYYDVEKAQDIIDGAIRDFINYLKERNLLEIYKEKWKCKK